VESDEKPLKGEDKTRRVKPRKDEEIVKISDR